MSHKSRTLYLITCEGGTSDDHWERNCAATLGLQEAQTYIANCESTQKKNVELRKLIYQFETQYKIDNPMPVFDHSFMATSRDKYADWNSNMAGARKNAFPDVNMMSLTDDYMDCTWYIEDVEWL